MKTKTENSNEELEENKTTEEIVEEIVENEESTDKSEVKEEIKKKSKEKIDYKTKYLESLAAMENFRKRLEAERIDLIKYSTSSLIQDLLPNIDMFRMALSSKEVSDEIKNWLMGFEMILKNIENSLESNGVKEIETKIGDEFDSSCHMAIEKKETDEFEPDKIIEIKNNGYKLHERLLRPTSVVVSSKKGE